MKNILKFGLLTRFVMLFLFIFGIHAFTPTVALADTLALGLKFLCENGAIAKKADGSDAEFIANEYTSDDLTQKFICNGKYVNTWDNSYEPTVGAITNNDLWSFITHAASNTSNITFTSSTYDGYATIKVTLDNQSATTAGTTEYYYKFNTYNGSCYYFSNSALTTCLAGAADGTKITIPTKTGYTFGGYYTGKNGAGTQYVDPEGKTINNIYKAVDTPTTLYAKWTHNVSTITLINTGATTARIDSLYYNNNRFYTDAKFRSEISASAAMTIPVRKYTVKYDAQSGTVSPTSASAQYTFDGYTVTIPKDGEYKVIDSNGKLVPSNKRYLLQAMQQGLVATVKWTGTPSVTLPTPTRDGHTFKGWYTSATNGTFAGNAGANYTVSSDTNLYAQWEAASTVPTITLNNNGATYKPRTKLYFNASNHLFYTDEKLRNQITASDLPVKKYKVTYDAQSGTMSSTYAYAQYTFDGYTVTIKGVKYKVIDSTGEWVSANKTYLLQAMDQGLQATAQWTGTPSVTLPMPTRSGYTFTGWSKAAQIVDIVGTANDPYTTNEDITLYAMWDECDACNAGTGATCSFAGVSDNTCAYTTTCKTGYSNIQNSGKYNPSCTANTYTITLDSKYYASSSATSGTNVSSWPYPDKIYEHYNNGWYEDDGLSMDFTSLIDLPVYETYVFAGFFTGKAGTGTQVIASDGRIIAPNFLFDSDDETIYAHYISCTCNSNDESVSSCSAEGTSGLNDNYCYYTVTCADGYSDNKGNRTFTGYGNKPGVPNYTPPCKKIGLTTGYNCEEDSTRYISCFAGNYMATMDALGNYEYNGEPTSDNSCQPCPADAAYCPGGTSAPLYAVMLEAEGLQSEYSILLANVNAEYYKDLWQDEETGNLTATRLEGTLPAEFMPTAPVGKTFNGYWTEGGEQYIDADGNFLKGPSADVTLHAQWSQCANGTYSENGRCVTCQEGSYCLNGIKNTCPSNSNSEAGQSYCKCNSGFSIGGTGNPIANTGEPCVPNVYTVELDNKGADTPGTEILYKTKIDNVSQFYEDKDLQIPITQIEIPTKRGHTFVGYAIGDSAGAPKPISATGHIDDSAGYTGTGSIKLYAIYQPDCYTVELKNPDKPYEIFGNEYMWGSEYYTDTCGGTPVHGDSIEKYTFWMHVIENATFAGYYSENNENSTQCVDENGKWTGDCSVTENTTWYELFKCNDGYTANGEYVDGINTQCAANVYTVGIVYSCGEHAGGEAPESPKRCSSNDDCTMPSADACGVYPGHTFKEWKFEREGGDEITVEPGQNVQSYIEGPENGATWLVVAQWTPDCNPLEVCYTPVEGESCATYYMRTGDNTQIYADNICDKETYIEQEHLGYVINGIPLGLFDSETEEQCLTENGYLTGNCSVTPNSLWIARYECEDGYTGIGSEVWSGDTCLPDCIGIELGYSENGDGGESYYSYYMKPGEYGYLYDGNCYTTKERLDTVETEYFGYDNHGTFVGFYMHDDNSDEIVQCTDSNGQILGDCENTVENNGTWWARYRCDTGYTANGDVIEAGDYEPCSNCYELGIIPSADYINTDVVYIQNNGSLYIDSVCQNPVQGDALEPKETPANAKFLGYTNKELPDVSYTGELADDFLCTSSDMNYQFGLTGNCSVSDNDQVWTAVYECAEGYRANGKFVDYDTDCSANKYTVTFDANGGAGTMEEQTFTYGVAQNLTANAFTYTGYTFAGWNTAANGSGTAYADKASVKNLATGGTITLYAQWTTDTVYTIEYYCSIDGFSGEVEMSKQCYLGQSDCVDFVDPGCENDDYSYSNLYFETGIDLIEGTVEINDGSSLMEILGLMADKSTNPNGITTIKVRPNWVAIPRPVTLNNQGADLGNGTEVFYVIDGKVYANSEDTTQTLSQITKPAKTGYNFGGYYDKTNCDGNTVVYFDGKINTDYFADKKKDMVLYACWNPDWQEIYYYYAYPDNNSSTPTSVQYGTEITIGKGLPTPEDTEEIEVKIGERPGYTFTGWTTVEGSNEPEYKNGDKYTVTHINVVLQLYATWAKNEYTINYYDGETLINTTTYTVDNVGMSLYEPDANEGYIFSGWYTQPNCTGEHISSINENNLGNYDLYACWTAGEYSLTYVLNDGEWAEGSNVTNPVGYTVEDLPMVLAVPERKGYTFNGWYNNENFEGTAMSKIVQPENITLYAKWDLTDYTITYFLNGGVNNPDNPTTYTIKDKVRLSDPTYNGKLFRKWSDTEDCSGRVITGWSGSDAVNKTLYACWKDAIISIEYLCDGKTQTGNSQTCNAFAEECTLNANICDGTVKGNYYNYYDIVGIDGSFGKNADLVMEGFIGYLLADADFWKADKPTLKLTPVWEPYIYGITLNNGEGVSNATIYSKYGVDKFYTNAQCNQTLPNNKVSVPNKDNYTFAGYSVDANSCEIDRVVIDYKGAIDTEKLKTYADETYVSDNPVELYACWEPVSFEVYYNLNDTNNSGTYRNTVVAYNTEVQIGTIIRPDDGVSETLKPEFVGHEFMGWSTERNGNPDNTYEQGALYTIKGHTTFYAQWKVMTFTCKSGEYLKAGETSCTTCPVGSACAGGTFSYDSTKNQSINACLGATEYQDQPGQTTCKTVSDGYYKKDNTAQTECGNGYYCKNAVRTVCPDNGLTDTATATDVTDCYKNNQSCTVNGGVGMSDVCYYDTTKSGYKNCDVCIINGCNSGYYKDNNTCTICPQGSYCANSDKNACPDKYTTAGTGATQQKDCFTTCDDMAVEYGIAHADNATVKAPAECTYSRGESVTGNPCDIKNGKCVETSCKFNYEMKGGKCTECVRDNARTFKQGNGNCVVESCEFGYYPDSAGQKCMPATKECTMLSMHAIAAQQTWDTKTNSYTVCQITECADGYHISNNTCISDEQTCNVPNGIGGVQTWNGREWSECVATKCKPGYTNDRDLMWPAHAKDISIQCGRCDNAFDTNGAEAAHTYVRECEIATCMYQGKKYILENNECRLICNAKDDETGSRYWDSKSEECVHTCNAGYQEW